MSATAKHRRIPHMARNRRRKELRTDKFPQGYGSYRSLVRELCRDEGKRMQDLLRSLPPPAGWAKFLLPARGGR
jgi:hypothetical protein